MSGATSAVLMAVTAAAAVYSAKTGADAAAEQKKANKKAQAQAEADATAAEREINRQNQKTPDLASILTSNKASTTGGAGSTMLTGAQGVGADQLTLGKSSLLGQ